jgi:hypothetical protein
MFAIPRLEIFVEEALARSPPRPKFSSLKFTICLIDSKPQPLCELKGVPLVHC